MKRLISAALLAWGFCLCAHAATGSSQVFNQSTVSGQTVTDALNSLSSGSLPSGSGNKILATPSGGGSGTAALRSMVIADLGALVGTSGGTIPLLNGNNTYSGTATFTNELAVNWNVVYGGGTSGPAFQPMNSVQNPSGIAIGDGAGNVVYNRFWIQSDNVDASAASNGAIGFQWTNVCCGSSAKSTRNTGQFIMNVTGIPADGGAGHSFVPLETTSQNSVNLGTSGSALFGFNPYVSNSGTVFGLIGQETDIANSGTLIDMVGMDVVNTGGTGGSRDNTAFGIGSNSPSVNNWTVAYSVGGSGGYPGMATTAKILSCIPHLGSGTCPGVADGVDMSLFASFSDCQYKGRGSFCVDNAGDVNTSATYNGSNITTLNGTSGGLILGIGPSVMTNIGTGAIEGTFIGQGAGGSGFNGGAGGTGLTGVESTCVGWHCMSQMTTGANNTGLGVNVFGFETTGNNDVAIGTDAMRNTVGTVSSIGIGVGALKNGTSGFNVAIGSNVMQGQTSTTGSNNTAVGTNAMSSTSWTTAGSNSAFGGNSLAAITTGNFNTAVGFQSGNAEISTSNGTFVGANAGEFSTGQDNTAVGAGALANASNSSSFNVIVGWGAASLLTSGAANVIIGPIVATTTLATGGNNVVIGTGSGCDTPAAGSNNTIELCAGTSAVISATGGASPSTSATKVAGTIGTNGYTVSTLPTGTAGDRAYVTDQLTTCAVVGAALTGGGAVVCPVFKNASAWVGG